MHASRLFRLFVSLTLLGAAAAQATPASPQLTATSSSPVSAGTDVRGVLAGVDFDGDGIADVATVDNTAKTVTVRFGNGAGGFRTPAVSFASGTDTLLALSAGLLVGGDSRPDVVTVADRALNIYPNSAAAGGGTQFGSAQVLTVPNISFFDVKAADLDSDGLSDLVASGYYASGPQQGQGVVVVLRNSATGYHPDTAAQILSAGTLPGRLALGDLNGDSTPDIAVTQNSGSIFVFRSTGAGTYGPGVTVDIFDTAIVDAVAIGQIGGDAGGDLAVICRKPAQGGFYYFGYVLLQQADGTFGNQVGIAFGPQNTMSLLSGDVALADINGDGQNDVVLTSPVTSAVYVLAVQLASDRTVDIAGSLTYHTDAKLQPRYLGVADLNKDGKTDVIAAGTNASGSLSLLLNGAGGGGTGGGGVTTLSKPVLRVLRATRTTPYTFQASFTKALDASATVTLEYTATPAAAGSWQAVPNAEPFTPNDARTLFTLSTNDLPLGKIFFRAVAASGSVRAASAPSPAFTIAAKVDARVAAALLGTNGEVKFSKPRGAAVYYNGHNAARLEKVQDVAPGGAAFFQFTTSASGDSSDTVTVQGPGQTTDGFLIRYFSDVSFTQDYSDQVVQGTLTVPQTDGLNLVAVVLPPPDAAPGTDKSIDLKVFSSRDDGIYDLARGTAHVIAPAPFTTFVTTAVDNGNNDAPTPGSLRAALVYAQQNVAHKVHILFQVPPGTASRSVLPLASDLPPLVLTALTEIDGTSNSLYVGLVTGNMKGQGPSVELRGTGAATGLTLKTSGALVRSLRFSNFTTGLLISGENLPNNNVAVRGNQVKNCLFAGNSDTGILITGGARSNLIGDRYLGSGNIFVSYRADASSPVIGNYGIRINGGSSYTTLYDNAIGFSSLANDDDDPDPTLASGFRQAGVSLTEGATHTNFGRGGMFAPNRVAGNQGIGLEILGAGTRENAVAGNIFGRTRKGTLRGNYGANILIDEGASFNRIGDSGLNQGNELVASSDVGVRIQAVVPGAPTAGNSLFQNRVGGANPGEGNANGGVLIVGAQCTGTEIGSNTGMTGNVFLGNGLGSPVGVAIGLSGGSDTLIYRNTFGIAFANVAGPNREGILLDGASGNVIAANLIAFTATHGIELVNASDNRITSNKIGVQESADGNGGVGILLRGSSNHNHIGDSERKAGNTIHGNGGKGVVVQDSSTGNSIRGNSILENAGPAQIDLGDDGVTPNDAGDADSGPNELQNAPVINSATVAGGHTTVSVTFKSTPQTGSSAPAYWIDFYADGDLKGSVKAFTDSQGSGFLKKTDGSGLFSVTFPGNLKGKEIRATATRTTGAGSSAVDGSTSEYSNGVTP